MTKINRSSSRRNRLSDRDIVMDLLVTQKYMSHFYDHAVMESSNSMVRNTFEAFQQDEHELGRVLFNAMQERGWYSVSTSEKPRNDNTSRLGRVKQTKQQFDLSAHSNYSTRSGSRRFGNRLRQNVSGNSPELQIGE